MKFSTRIRLKILRDYIIGWTVSFIFLSIIRGVGTEELGSLKFGFLDSLIMSFSLGPIMGLISGIAQVWTEERLYRRIPILRLLLLRFLYGVLFLGAMIIIAYLIYQAVFGTEVDLFTFAFDQGSGAITFYVLVTDFVLSVIRQVNLMLGEGNLGRLLQGKFYQPREEQRIFMFLDLQASTTLAEQLGHIKYSSLVQECFNDLGIVIENEAEIYQYVGDEAVLTWTFEKGIKNSNAIKAFFSFKNLIASKSKYYQSTYGVVPFFKAGLHGGTVTVTEIGKYKKEIAYHGDPINTAARIQGQCNTLDTDFLISKSLMESLDSGDFQFQLAGSIHLRGKEKTMELNKITEY